jgi:outer membrane protein
MIRLSTYLTALLIFLSFESVYGQNQKIGFIDSDIIMQNIPEYSGIEQRLSLLSESWRQEIMRMERSIEDLENDFAAREILFTEDIRAQRLREIEEKRDQLDRYIEEKFGPNGDYFSRQKELLEPIQRAIFEALSRVASRLNYDFIFDRADDIRFLYAGQEWNLTDEVMLEMGLDGTRN